MELRVLDVLLPIILLLLASLTLLNNQRVEQRQSRTPNWRTRGRARLQVVATLYLEQHLVVVVGRVKVAKFFRHLLSFARSTQLQRPRRR